MAKRFQMPFAQWVNTNSVVQGGAKLEFFESGTSTQLDTFTSEAGTVANANPVIADSAGQFPAIFLQARDYKVTLKTSADQLLWTADPVIGGVEGTGQLLRRGYIDGFTLSVSGDNTTFGAGECQDSTNTSAINLLSSLVKRIDQTWVAGAGLGGRASAVSLSNNTTYHCFVILNTATGAADAGFDTSVSANALLDDATGFTKYRRVGSVLTDGSANIVAFLQRPGGNFAWDVPKSDVNTNNPGTSAISATLSTPTGVKVLADLQCHIVDGSANAAGDDYLMLVTDLDQTDTVPIATGPTSIYGISAVNAGFAAATGNPRVWTNTSSQVRYRIDASDASVTARINTLGWYDPRGQDD